MKIWICENCSAIPKKTDKILKNLLNLQQELKSMKKTKFTPVGEGGSGR